jgi:hypothetical protein
MTKPIKTELTRDEVVKLLEIYNCMDALVDDSMEMMDVRLSQLSDLRDKAHTLRFMFNFRHPMNENGDPSEEGV